MNFVIRLSETSDKFLIQATKTLKNEGQEISKILPNGSKIRFIRGPKIEAHGFGDKYTLYKEITNPDGFRAVANTSVIKDEVFVNELFLIEPNSWCPDYAMFYDKYYYMPQPGITNEYRIQEPAGLDRRPQQLKDLLLKKVRPFNEASRKRSEKSWAKHQQNCAEDFKKHHNGYNPYDAYSRTAHGSSYHAGTNSSQTGTSSTGKISKEQFVDYMLDKFSHLNSKEKVAIRTLKDSEIRNLAKLFGISEDEVRNLDKSTKRKLVLKYHPDNSDACDNKELSTKIFEIVDKLKTVE